MNVSERLRIPAIMLVARGSLDALCKRLSDEGIRHVIFDCLSGDCVAEARRVFERPELDYLHAVGQIVEERIRHDTTFVIMNVDESPIDFKITLQALVDRMAFGGMMNPDAWQSAGNLILFEPDPSVYLSRRAPLYGRATATIVVE